MAYGPASNGGQLLQLAHHPPKAPPLNFAELEVDDRTRRNFARSGVLRDMRGLPVYDSAPEMAPIYARGLEYDLGVYHEMSRGDSVIAGTLGALRTTIGRGTYTVQAQADETPAEQDARELLCAYAGLSTDLGRRAPRWSGALEGGLTRHFYQAASRQVYGFAAFEVISSQHQWRGRTVVVPSRLKWIPPWSVARWLWQGDRVVGLTQVTQVATDYSGSFGESNMVGFSLGAGWRYADIPATRLLVYVNQYAEGNPEGTSELRSLWLPWAAKKAGITGYEAAKEALYGGFGHIKEVAKADGERFAQTVENVQTLLEDAVDKLVAGRVSRLTTPLGYDVEIKHPEYDIPSPTAVWTL